MFHDRDRIARDFESCEIESHSAQRAGRGVDEMTGFNVLGVAAPADESTFERALSAEIAASEQLRVAVLAATLAVVLVVDQFIFLFARDIVEQLARRPLPA